MIDTTALHYRVWDEFARAHNFIPTQSELLATNGRRAAETIRLWLGAQLNDKTVTAMTANRETYFNRLLETEPVAAVAGVEAFVAGLTTANIPRAVVTSAVPANAELALKRVSMQNAFNAIITAADVQRGKPDPEGYLKAAASLSIPIGKCVVIEDSIPGIRAAKAAGARCIALATTFPRDSLAAEQPDWLVADFLDLPIELHP